jgi:hypothetical protein
MDGTMRPAVDMDSAVRAAVFASAAPKTPVETVSVNMEDVKRAVPRVRVLRIRLVLTEYI